jgi:ribosome recycling factor
VSDYLEPFTGKMKKSIDAFADDLSAIRAGRANPRILDGVSIDYYGAQTPISKVGNISAPEARLLVVQPWETKLLKDIEKAIMAANLGINPTNDGKVIRLVFPELTEERRVSLTKEVKKRGEAAKVAVRNIRRDAAVSFKKLEKSSEITEDRLEGLLEDIQKETDKSVENIDKIVKAKNEEIMKI